jgi:hypothetical protein
MILPGCGSVRNLGRPSFSQAGHGPEHVGALELRRDDDQKKERDNEDEEVYQLLSDNYQDFLRMALRHTDLRLFTPEQTPELTDEQRERMLIIFSMLVSLFERAYLLLYEPKMSGKHQRRWRSWEDYMREWCRRGDFRALLPSLLEGEDPEFRAYIRELAEKESPTGSLLLSS